MNKKFFAAMTAAVVLVVVGTSVALVSASPDIVSARTIRVILKNREIGLVDLAPTGASQGDLRITHAPLYNREETKKVGHFEAVCTVTRVRPDESQVTQCNYTVRFAGGEIALQTVNSRPALSTVTPSDVAAVTGGTGIFQNSRGELHLLVPHGDKRLLVFHLIP